jgi:hypothetical protein
MLRSLVGPFVLLGTVSAAYTQTTYINPNGGGGYTIYTPRIGDGF